MQIYAHERGNSYGCTYFISFYEEELVIALVWQDNFFTYGMATVFLTNFIRCRTSFRMLFRLSLTMSLLGCDDLRQELTVKVRLPR